MNYTQNEKIEQVTDETLVVGVDIGSQTHYARAFDNRGRELTRKVFVFHNDLEGFNSFNFWTETLKADNKKTKVLVGCEPTGHYTERRGPGRIFRRSFVFGAVAVFFCPGPQVEPGFAVDREEGVKPVGVIPVRV